MLYGNKSNNQRESGTPYIRNAAQTQFERTMKREGRIVTTYTGGTEFRAFFRTRDEHENQRETIIMYYDVTAPVRPGTLVMVGYGVFLALNRETSENDIYYKSVMVKCNGVFNENTGIVHNVPFYCSNMKSSVSVGNNVITMLNGNIELITEENSLSKQIDICQSFNEFSRTFEVTNKWVEKNVSETISITVVNADVPVTPESTYKCNITGNTNLKNGYRRTYTVTFTDKDGNVMDWQEFDYQWNVLADFDIKQTVSENKITLSIDNEDLIGEHFLLQVLVEDETKAEVTVNIVE